MKDTVKSAIGKELSRIGKDTPFTPDAIAYRMRFSGLRVSRYDVIDTLHSNPEFKRVSPTDYARF